MNSALFSSKKDTWGTPREVFAQLDAEYGPFVLDAAALPDSALCPFYFTPETDALKNSWAFGGPVFMNPPYGRIIGKFLKKAVRESLKHSLRVVCLIPARTDTKWFHAWVMPWAAHVRLVQGRIRFNGASNGATFPSAVVVYDQDLKADREWPQFTPLRLGRGKDQNNA